MSIRLESIFDYFDVGSQEELMSYMRNNPSDPKVKELKELLEFLGTKGDENE